MSGTPSIQHRHESAESFAIVAGGATTAEALSDALTTLLPLLTDGASTGGGRAAPIRAEAAGTEELLAALAGELVERMEALGEGAAAVDVHGVIRSDDGYVAWGMVELAATPAAAPPVQLRFAGVTVREELGGVTIEATVERVDGAR